MPQEVPFGLSRVVAAEKAFLGAMLVSEAAAREGLATLAEEDFQVYLHRLVYRAISRLQSEGQSADYLSVREVIRREGKLRCVGGPSAIDGLLDFATEFSPLPYYARIIRGPE